MLAVLYDIHGNLPALQAVVADARTHGAERFVLGGDYAAFGPWPAETVAELDELGPAIWIRGNWDRWNAGDAADMPDDEVVRGADRFVHEALPAKTIARFGALPATAALDGTLFCHASPKSDVRAFAPDDARHDHALLAGTRQSLVVFGHIHVQLRRPAADGRTLVNPGSVGLPLDGDRRAAYALVDLDRGVDLHRVEYDVDATIEALRARDEPWADAVADRLERAAF
jgi:diadenosine tetraphosphatase ApaH/serine/threonine PP2A family protein phosphatase